MKKVITPSRYQQAHEYESAYWISHQHDAVGIIRDLESVFTLAQHLQKNGYLTQRFHRFLDLGCGALGMGILWLIESDELYGLDPLTVLTPKTGKIIVDKFINGIQKNVRYLVSKGESMPFKDNFFDCIVCNNVLDHVHNPYSILNEVKRILSPDGLFALSVNTHSLRSLISKKTLKQICPNFGDLPGHPYEWTEKQITNVLKMHGFMIESHIQRSIKGRLLGKVRRTTYLLRHVETKGGHARSD